MICTTTLNPTMKTHTRSFLLPALLKPGAITGDVLTEGTVMASKLADGSTDVYFDDAHAYTPPRTIFLYLKP